jgi:hypothetical protein
MNHSQDLSGDHGGDRLSSEIQQHRKKLNDDLKAMTNQDFTQLLGNLQMRSLYELDKEELSIIDLMSLDRLQETFQKISRGEISKTMVQNLCRRLLVLLKPKVDHLTKQGEALPDDIKALQDEKITLELVKRFHFTPRHAGLQGHRAQERAARQNASSGHRLRKRHLRRQKQEQAQAEPSLINQVGTRILLLDRMVYQNLERIIYSQKMIIEEKTREYVSKMVWRKLLSRRAYWEMKLEEEFLKSGETTFTWSDFDKSSVEKLIRYGYMTNGQFWDRVRQHNVSLDAQESSALRLHLSQIPVKTSKGLVRVETLNQVSNLLPSRKNKNRSETQSKEIDLYYVSTRLANPKRVIYLDATMENKDGGSYSKELPDKVLQNEVATCEDFHKNIAFDFHEGICAEAWLTFFSSQSEFLIMLKESRKKRLISVLPTLLQAYENLITPFAEPLLFQDQQGEEIDVRDQGVYGLKQRFDLEHITGPGKRRAFEQEMRYAAHENSKGSVDLDTCRKYLKDLSTLIINLLSQRFEELRAHLRLNCTESERLIWGSHLNHDPRTCDFGEPLVVHIHAELCQAHHPESYEQSDYVLCSEALRELCLIPVVKSLLSGKSDND